MKKLVLIFLVILIGLTIASCAKQETKTVTGVEEEGILGPVLSESKAVAKQTTRQITPMGNIIKTGFNDDILLIADFNSGSKPSNIGGDFGAWDKDPADFTQTCTDSFDPVNKYGQSGFSMKLDYDVDSANPAYNGFWMKLNNLDASKFNRISFFVKGDENEGYTTVFKIELKNAAGEVGKFYVTGIDSTWKEISILLNQFHGITDFSNLTEFVIVFEDMMATNKDGIIYIDDIKLVQ